MSENRETSFRAQAGETLHMDVEIRAFTRADGGLRVVVRGAQTGIAAARVMSSRNGLLTWFTIIRAWVACIRLAKINQPLTAVIDAPLEQPSLFVPPVRIDPEKGAWTAAREASDA